MKRELGQQLVYAFANDTKGGNPSYVVATSGQMPEIADRCITLAQQYGCEVSHIHFPKASTRADIRFYVSTGAIAFCGHGAIAATAWAVAAGHAQGALLLDYGSGQVMMQIRLGGHRYGFAEPAGNWTELATTEAELTQLRALLGLPNLQADEIRLWLGGRQRAKVLIRFRRRRHLSQLQVHPTFRDQFCLQHEATGIYLFAVEGPGLIVARHFPVYSGTHEDMATGNIAPTVGDLLSDGQPCEFVIMQGGPGCDVARLELSPHDGKWFVGGICRFSDNAIVKN